MTGRRHSAPLTSDLQRYGTRARPGGRGEPSNRWDTCLMSETELLSDRDNLRADIHLSWTSEEVSYEVTARSLFT